MHYTKKEIEEIENAVEQDIENYEKQLEAEINEIYYPE